MLKLIKIELLKLWTKKSFVGVLAVLTLANMFLLWYTENGKADAIPSSAYTKLAADIQGMSEKNKVVFIDEKSKMLAAVKAWEDIHLIEAEQQNEYTTGLISQMKEENPDLEKYRAVFESGQYLTYTSSLQSEMAFLTEIQNETSKISEYQGMLDDIEKQAKKISRVSIFSGDNTNFSSRNIIQTRNDYEGMQGADIKYCITKGFTAATNFLVTDIIAILVMFLLSTLLIYDEKDKNLFALIKSTARGRGATVAAKMSALGISMLVITLLLFGANLLYTGLVYDLPYMGYALQSVPQFISSTLKINIGEYLVLFLASKFFAYFTVSLLIFLVALLSRHPAITYVSAGAVLAVSFIIYQIIPAVSTLNIFKYVNLISFIRTNGLYQVYLNLNLFGHPINLIPFIWTALTAVFIVAGTVCFFVFCKKKNMQAGKLPFQALMQKVSLFKYRPSSSIFRYESHKLFIVSKVALLLLVFIALQWYGNRDAKFYTAYDEVYYNSYMTRLAGGLTSEKQSFLEQEQKKYSDAEDSLNAINRLVESGEMTREQADTTSAPFQKTLLGKPSFTRIMERYRYIQENPKADFVYDTGYNRLFGITANNDSVSAFMLVLICIICFSALYPMEYKTGVMKLIGTTPLGKAHTAKCKILVCVTALVPFFLAVYIPDILLVKGMMGSLTAPIMSLPTFSHFTPFMPIWGYLLLLYLTRFIVCVIILLTVLTVSRFMKNSIIALLVSSFLFAVPIILYFMNVQFIYPFTMLPLLHTNSLFTGEYLFLLPFGIILVVSVVGGYVFTKFPVRL